MSINNDLCLHAHQCPITHQRMIDPVIASDGYTYEREAVQKWLKTKSTSPMTNEPMDGREGGNSGLDIHTYMTPDTQILQ